jgi:hypothetical protein
MRGSAGCCKVTVTASGVKVMIPAVPRMMVSRPSG